MNSLFGKRLARSEIAERCWPPSCCRGSKVKYELDKDTGMLFIDRILYSSVVCECTPATQGALQSPAAGTLTDWMAHHARV